MSNLKLLTEQDLFLEFQRETGTTIKNRLSELKFNSKYVEWLQEEVLKNRNSQLMSEEVNSAIADFIWQDEHGLKT